MATRAFTVFIDEPSAAPTRPALRSASRGTTPLLSPGGSCLVLPDKENTHPVTGARASSVGLGGKTLKRKTGVLETKLYVPPTTKKSKDAAKAGLGEKKRGMSAPPEVAAPPSPTRKAKKKTTSTSAGSTSGASVTKAKRTTTRKASAKRVAGLPPVHEEEPEPSSAPGAAPLSMSQAEIDSRCYDLTVSPLADVSEAYEPPVSDKATSQLEVLRVPKKSRAKGHMIDTDIRDYFDASHSVLPRKFTRSVSLPVEAFSYHVTPFTTDSPISAALDSIPTLSQSASQSTVASSTSISASSTSTLVSPTQSPSAAGKTKALELSTMTTLNTPERKQVYAAFTFATPSPSADRFRRTRSTSVDHFGDIVFNPLALA